MNKILSVDYDTKFDTLYVGLGDRSSSYGDDSQAGIILLRDIKTERLTGFTILSFFKKYKAQKLPNLPGEISCSIEKDIIPKIYS